MLFDQDEIRASREDDLYGADEVLIFGEWRRPRSELEMLMDELEDSMMLRSNRLLGPLLGDDSGLFRHHLELMSMEIARRRKAVRRAPYRDLRLANLFLDESTKKAPKSPERAEELAVVAEWIADQPWPEESEKATLIRVDAFICQGKARCLLRDWRGADLRFGGAFAILKDLPLCDDHVSFCRSLSGLREAEGRLHEAEALLVHAIHLDWEYRLLMRTLHPDLVQLAILCLKQNEIGRAMTLFTELSKQVDEPYSGLGSYRWEILFGQAICLAALGLAEPARRLLEQSQPDRRALAERDHQLPLEWLECRISVHLGDLDRAIPRLEAIRRWLLRRGKLEAVCLCSIDLALAHVKQGGLAERLPGILEDIAEISDAAEHPWALGSLWWFRTAVEQQRDPAAAAREAAEIVHRWETSLRGLVEIAKSPSKRSRRRQAPGKGKRVRGGRS